MAGCEMQSVSALTEEVRDEIGSERRVFKKRRNYPIFIVGISLLQIGLFIYDHICLTQKGMIFGWDDNRNYFPVHHPLILNRDKKVELWRFYTYAFVHGGGQHLFFNMLLQIVTGIPLEIENGSLRVCLVHTLGVLVANLPLAFHPFKYGCGGSGGSYCIAAAKLAITLSSIKKSFDQRGGLSRRSEDYEAAANRVGLSSKRESSHLEAAQDDQVCEQQAGVDSRQRGQVNVKVETGNSIFSCVIWVLVILCMTIGVEIFTTYRCYASGHPYWYFCRAHFAHLTASLEGACLGIVFLNNEDRDGKVFLNNEDRVDLVFLNNEDRDEELCGKMRSTRIPRWAAIAVPVLTISALAFYMASPQ